jgi:hypothetical protein
VAFYHRCCKPHGLEPIAITILPFLSTDLSKPEHQSLCLLELSQGVGKLELTPEAKDEDGARLISASESEAQENETALKKVFGVGELAELIFQYLLEGLDGEMWREIECKISLPRIKETGPDSYYRKKNLLTGWRLQSILREQSLLRVVRRINRCLRDTVDNLPGPHQSLLLRANSAGGFHYQAERERINAFRLLYRYCFPRERSQALRNFVSSLKMIRGNPDDDGGCRETITARLPNKDEDINAIIAGLERAKW